MDDGKYKEFQEYHAPVRYHGMKRMKDVYVKMRDGVDLCIDINLPDGEGPFPALLSFGQHNKDRSAGSARTGQR